MTIWSLWGLLNWEHRTPSNEQLENNIFFGGGLVFLDLVNFFWSFLCVVCKGACIQLHLHTLAWKK